MSLLWLTNACNQKNNRNPKSELSEEEVGQAIEELRQKRLAHRVDLVGSRVPKFQHNAEKELDLIKAERALLSELLNRGPQTSGELTPGQAECLNSTAYPMLKKPCRIYRKENLHS